VIVPPDWEDELPGSVKVIRATTPSVCVLQRIFIRGEAEYDLVRSWQDGITLAPLASLWREGARFPVDVDVAEYEIPAMRATTDPLVFFEHMSRYTGRNPPGTSDEALMAVFRTVGLGPGAVLPEDELLRRAIVEGADDARDLIDATITAAPTRGGWQIPDRTAGIPGPHILRRAAVQMSQMGIFPNEEAMYFFAFRDADDRTLDGAGRYHITFPAGQLPPLHEHGFWSLTMYNRVSLLAENPIGRYALRPDSSSFTFAEDGSLTLVLSASLPDDVPEGNWLPMPEGACNIALRTYQPTPAIVDGTWFPPPVVRVA
jgi:hypothetical protein